MERYTRTAITLHWLIALLIIGTFTMGLVMTDIPGITPTKLKYYSWHKWAGVTILLLAAVRLLWRLKNAAPAYPGTMQPWEKTAASTLHGVLYVLFFAVPLSGYFYSLAAGVPVVYFGIIPLPILIERNAELKETLEGVHYWLNMGLLACVIAHVAAALKHQFIDKDGIMKRMMPGRPTT